MVTLVIAVINETENGGYLVTKDWATAQDALRGIVHSYNVQQLSKLEHGNYLIGVLGTVDESDVASLTLSVAVMAVAFKLKPGYVGVVAPATTPLKIGIEPDE